MNYGRASHIEDLNENGETEVYAVYDQTDLRCVRGRSTHIFLSRGAAKNAIRWIRKSWPQRRDHDYIVIPLCVKEYGLDS